MDEFLADNASDARAKVVDRLLKSVAYGERMALNGLTSLGTETQTDFRITREYLSMA